MTAEPKRRVKAGTSKPAPEAEAEIGHNQPPADDDAGYKIAAGEIRSFIERFERLAEEKKAIADDQKELMAEAKGRGYDTKTLRTIIKLRTMDPNERAEAEAMVDLYKTALGMA